MFGWKVHANMLLPGLLGAVKVGPRQVTVSPC